MSVKRSPRAARRRASRRRDPQRCGSPRSAGDVARQQDSRQDDEGAEQRRERQDYRPRKARVGPGIAGSPDHRSDIMNAQSCQGVSDIHPVERSNRNGDHADARGGRMRACAIACHASRCARMSSSTDLRSASLSSASASRCRSSSSALNSASRAARQGISASNRLADGSGSTGSIS
jgi:hypothetical protein